MGLTGVRRTMGNWRGSTATLTRATGGSFDPSTGDITGGSSSTRDIDGVRVTPVEQREVDGQAVRITDLEAWIPNDCNTAPVADDTIEVNGTTYRVQRVASAFDRDEVRGWRCFIREGSTQ